jgi:hypothetical protein
VRKTILALTVSLACGGLAPVLTHGAESTGKAFLDSQTMHDRRKANCTGFKSLRFKAATTLLHAEGPGSSELVQFSYLERVQDGQCFLVRYTNASGSPEDVNAGNLGVTSFDGRFHKEYEPWLGRGYIGTKLSGRVPEWYNPVLNLMGATLQTDYGVVRPDLPPDHPTRRVIERFKQEYPSGLPGLSYGFMLFQANGHLRVLPDLETVNGMSCHVVEMGDPNETLIRQWFAHDRGMLLVKDVARYQGGDSSKDDILDVASADTPKGRFWYPKIAIREANTRGSLVRYKHVVYDFMPNIQVPPETFDVNLPDGVTVTDFVAHKSFIRDKSLALVYDEAKGEFRQVPREAAKPGEPAAKAPLTAGSLLKEVLRQYAARPPCTFEIETKGFCSDGREGSKGSRDTTVSKIRMDGARIDLDVQSYGEEAGKRTSTGSARIIWNGTQCLRRIQGVYADGSLVVMASSNRGEAASVLASPFQGGFLDGFLGDTACKDLHVAAFLLESPSLSILPALRDVGGHLCHVVTASVGDANYQVWIDPNAGFNVRKAVVRWSGGECPGMILTVDNLQIERIGPVWIPVSGTWATTYETHSDIQSFTARRSKIVWNPDFAAMGVFQMEGIPDGTRVTKEDSLGGPWMWKEGRVVRWEAGVLGQAYESLIGKPIPDFHGTKIDLTPDHARNKILLICFCDMQQRPSRQILRELADKAADLKARGVVLLAIQAAEVEQAEFDTWVKEQGASLSIGRITANVDGPRSKWGVKALPWLILADKQHVVRAEGFGVDSLGERPESIIGK